MTWRILSLAVHVHRARIVAGIFLVLRFIRSRRTAQNIPAVFGLGNAVEFFLPHAAYGFLPLFTTAGIELDDPEILISETIVLFGKAFLRIGIPGKDKTTVRSQTDGLQKSGL